MSNLRHGHAGRAARSPEYMAWAHAKRRCFVQHDPGYASYGGRGITVCERWQAFEGFLADMGPRPSPAHSLDRINNDGDYEPGNCRWATRREQRWNLRPCTNSVRPVVINGIAFGLKAACRQLRLSPDPIKERLAAGLGVWAFYGPGEAGGAWKRREPIPDDTVRTVIAQYHQGGVSMGDLAIRHGVSRTWVGNILQGRRRAGVRP
jgi:hypothetical protein